jgi:hypothetical protein
MLSDEVIEKAHAINEECQTLLTRGIPKQAAEHIKRAEALLDLFERGMSCAMEAGENLEPGESPILQAAQVHLKIAELKLS